MPAMTQPPAQPPAGQPYPPPYAQPVSPPPFYPPPKKKSFWSSTGGVFAILGMVFGGVILLCVGLAAVGLVSDRNAASKMDVQITSCKFTGSEVLPSATVGYTVVNNGDSTRSVSIKIEYRDSSGARIDTDTAYVRDVKAGDTVRGEETTLLDAAPSGSGECVVVGVS